MLLFDTQELSSLWLKLAEANLDATVAVALREDGAADDVTTAALCDPHSIARASLVARDQAVCAGLGVVDGFAARDRKLGLGWCKRSVEGKQVAAGEVLLVIEGPISRILPIERSLSNLVGIAMGTATLTARYVSAVAGTRALICDTRKTIPGLRWLQKYAVRCGGGTSHRFGLHDALLVKDNHVAGLDAHEYARRIQKAVEGLRASGSNLSFTCAEADTLEQFGALLSLPAGTIDIALLDNFTNESLAQAVAMRDRLQPKLKLEASGGVTLESISAIARTGVDRISVGALTHSAPWADVALDIDAA